MSNPSIPTVGALIEALRAFPADMPVRLVYESRACVSSLTYVERYTSPDEESGPLEVVALLNEDAADHAWHLASPRR